MRTGTFLLLFIAASTIEAAPIYTVTDLGPLGSGTVTSINNAGTVSGYSQSAAGRQAFSSSGALQNPSGESAASQGNNFGQVAGTVFRNGRAGAAMWTNGLVSLLGLTGSAESYGNALNDWGWLAGGAIDGQGNMTAYLLEDGAMRWLGTLSGGGWSSANAVSAGGQVAGTSEVSGGAFHAFVWSAGAGMADLGTLGGASSYGVAINRSGTVVGNSFTAAGVSHAFAHDGASMRDLGTLGRGSSYATGISSSGDIVGYSDASPTEANAFLYRNATMTNLNRLIAADAGWRLLEAHAINDNGQIAGVGLLKGERRAFRLDPATGGFLDQALLADSVLPPLMVFSLAASADAEPTPEPGTFGIFTTAGLLFAALRIPLRRLRR